MVTDTATLDELRLQALRKAAIEKSRSGDYENVYRADIGKLITVPKGMDADQVKYFDNIQNNGDDKKDYFGTSKIGNPLDFVKRYVRGVAEGGTALQSVNLDIYERQLDRIEKLKTGERKRDVWDWLFEPGKPIWSNKTKDQRIADRELKIKNKINEIQKVNKNMASVLDAIGLGGGDTFAGDLGGGFQSLVQSIGLTVATGNPLAASAVISAQQKSQTYQEGRDKGLDIKSASGASIIDAAGVAAIEAIGTQALFKTFGESTALRRVFKGFVTEAVEEGTQNIWSDVIKNGYDIQNKTAGDVLYDAVYAAFIGGILGASVSGISGPQIKEISDSTGLKEEQIVNVINSSYQKGSEDAQAQEIAFSEIDKSIDMELSKPDRSAGVLQEAQKNLELINTDVQEDYISKVQEFIDYKPNDSGMFSAPKKVYEELSYGTSRFLEPISTRIRQISEPLFYRIRKYEMNTKIAINNDMAVLHPFLSKFSKLSKDKKKEVDFVLKNVDIDQQNSVAKKYGIESEMRNLRAALDEVFMRAEDAGVDVTYRQGFFPRKVKDLNGLLKYLRKTEQWGVFEQAFENKEKQTGRSLSNQEKEDIINTLLRGFKTGGVSLKDAGVFGERMIEEITPELNQFYESTDQALLSYFVTANEDIETKKLFGKGAETTEESIGAIVNDMVNRGEIDESQAQNLKDALGARFNRGRMSANVEAVKNIMYLETMGSNFGSTLRQIGDLGISAYKYGIMNTASSIIPSIKGDTIIDVKDIGIEKIAQEFENSSYTGKLLTNVFELTGLSKVDRMGKRNLIQSAFNKLQKQANSEDVRLSKQLEMMFGKDMVDVVINDIKSNNTTMEVKELLFNELADAQPVALSEMPEMYLRSGTGRIFYILKSFTLRQLDIYRRDGTMKINEGIRTNNKKLIAEGASNITKLLFFMVSMNVGVDYVWDFIKHIPQMMAGEGYEPPEIEDEVVDNIWKSFGLNKYGFEKMSRPYMGALPGETIFSYALPPTKTLDNMWKDWQSIQNDKLGNPKDLRTLRSIPVGGEMYWFWFGGGSETKKTPSNNGNYTVKSNQ